MSCESKIIKNVNLENGHAIDSKGEVIDGVWYKNAKISEFENNYYIVSNKAVLTITATSFCNAKCKFCYNGITYTPQGKYIDVGGNEFKRTLEFCKNANIKIAAISGGEPTIYPEKLLEMIELIKDNFKFIRIHTNGSNLLKKIEFNGEEKCLWEHICKYKNCQISISLAHYDKKKNSEIMKHDFDVYEVLEKMNGRINCRLSCYLDEEGLKDEEMLEYIKRGTKYGVKEYIFRFSTDLPDVACYDSSTTRCNKLAESNIDKYSTMLQERGFEIQVYEKKTDSTIYILKKDGIKVDLSKSGEEIDPDKKIRRVLYMPDNRTYYSWIDKGSFLF